MNTDHRLPRPGHQSLRRGRVSQPRQIYHVTTATAAREPLFLNLILARLVIRRLHDRELIGGTTNLCWVVMPDHLHWLLQLGDEPDLSTLLRRFKALTSLDINRQLDRRGVPVWQPSFHDHALRREEDVEAIARVHRRQSAARRFVRLGCGIFALGCDLGMGVIGPSRSRL